MNINAKEFVSTLTDEELVGEVLCWRLSDDDTEEKLLNDIKEKKISGVWVNGIKPGMLEFVKKTLKENSKSPALICADVEYGPIFTPEIKDCRTSMMGLGATNDEALAFNIGKYTGRIMRSMGINFAFSPVVDINYNFENPVTNIRAASDDPEKVLKIAGGYARGNWCEGMIGASLKHFPGDGMDDRNQHFCTTVNNLSREEWMSSYGMIYKSLFDEGAPAVMVGHIALPWCDPTCDENGHFPATLSKPIITDLLKGELGFKGCVVSDAMSMIGTAARVPIERLSVEFLRAGGDLIVFPEEDDHKRILNALHSGYLDRERLTDAAERVVKLKIELGLFEDREPKLDGNELEKIVKFYNEAAKKSPTLIKNSEGVLPMSLGHGAKILAVTLSPKERDYEGDDFPEVADELVRRGFEVIRMTNPTHYRIKEIINEVDAVFICSYINTMNCSGSSMRLGWNNLMTFWRGYILQNKNVAFISFGDPYKPYELPFLKTYVNSYYNSRAVVSATIDACLGDAQFLGVSPVKIPNR